MKIYPNTLEGRLEEMLDARRYNDWVREHWWRDRQNWWQLWVLFLLLSPVWLTILWGVARVLSE